MAWKNENYIFIFSNVDWDFNFQRHQAIATILSKKNRVVYLNPYKTWRGNWKLPYFKRVFTNLYVGEFFPLFPGESRLVFLRKINRFLYRVFFQILFLLLGLLGRKVIIYQFFPRSVILSGQVGDWIDFLPVDFPNLREQKDWDIKLYATYSKKIVTHPLLRDYLIKKGIEGIKVLGNGIFYSYYQDVFIKNLYRWGKGGYKIETVGYIGGTHEIDFNILEQLSLKYPELTFLVVGPIDQELERNKLSSNLILKDKVPYREIKKYLTRIDLLLVPFKKNGVTKRVDPIKVYEAAACGIPVVATDFSPYLPSWIVKDDKLVDNFSCWKDIIEEENIKLDLSYFLRSITKFYDWNHIFKEEFSEFIED